MHRTDIDSDRLRPFEIRVLEMLLDGDHPVLAVLREQLSACYVVDRYWSGVGFFTTLRVTDDAPLAPPKTPPISDVWGEISGIEHGVGYVVFLEGGQLSLLEGFSFVSPWDGEDDVVRLYYDDPSRAGTFAELDAAAFLPDTNGSSARVE